MPDDYSLAYGTHASPQDGRCAMEWVSHLAGEPHSDQPACVSPVLRAMCIALNDGFDDVPRQRLRPYLTRTIGTAEDGLDQARGWMAMDWLVRFYTPVWLEPAGYAAEAADLCVLAPVLDETALHAALSTLERARAVTHAGRSLGWGAVQTAGRSTAREAAWACAGAAAWAAARLAIGDMAGDRARAAARSAAADSAASVAIDALHTHSVHGRAAARETARRALAPTLTQLETSVLGLLERMLPLEPIDVPLPAAVART